MQPISHVVAEIMRKALSQLQHEVMAADDIPEMTKFRLVSKISDDCFKLIDDLAGVRR